MEFHKLQGGRFVPLVINGVTWMGPLFEWPEINGFSSGVK